MKQPVHFLYLILSDDQGKGHHYPYAASVLNACSGFNWTSSVFVPETYYRAKENKDWYPELKNCRTRKGSRSNLFGQIKKGLLWLMRDFAPLSSSIRKQLKNHWQNKKHSHVIFLEDYGPQELLALFIAVAGLFGTKDLFVILHRYSVSSSPLLRMIYKLLFLMLEKVTKGQMIYVTDSDLLAKSWGLFLKTKCDVLPIPHTFHSNNNNKSLTDKVVVWWPGFPRPEKGLEIIRYLSCIKDVIADQIELIVAKSAHIGHSEGSVNVRVIPDFLEPNEYKNLFDESDIILIPYDQNIYKEATSGIFCEAIVAGRIPLVNSNTWMAYELAKFDLNELIADWQREDIVPWILSLPSNKILRDKLDYLKEYYSVFHTEESFANKFKQIIAL